MEGCFITANFYVSITIDIQTEQIVSVSAGLTSGSIDCPTTNVMNANIAVTYSGRYTTGADFSSSVSLWDEAMLSIANEIVDDVNADIDTALG